ncbi:MAG TPA: GerMN domain-containing protein [Candidatus Fusicatenibacter intestinigallinarum]|uniref:GerMN domain-containing protein n=1 Tax=Candidatus Fusicatenibacter intestinigallinarum TaxID=2838598 RepID=A0A9D2SMN7_9FIRM|nr:GerMN domain-containing protein [Candidatus Fusicatenibacter intestinigallinarum]
MRRWFSVLAVLILLAGCSRSESEEKTADYFMYYLSLDGNQVVENACEPEASQGEELIQEFAEKFNETPEKEDYQRLMAKDVEIEGWTLEDSTLTLKIRGPYESMSRPREVLVRAGLVRGFTQIPEVERVQITTEDGELKDSSGNVIGPMTRESFVENAGKEINNYQYTTLTLYFANETGDKLVSETRSVYYSTSMPLERVVVEQLVKGPSEEGHYAVLSPDTNILSVTTSDNIAYVNFDETFVNGTISVAQEIPIYALVNSITTNCPVQRVQFSINGESDVTFRESMKLNQFYEKDLSYLEENSE